MSDDYPKVFNTSVNYSGPTPTSITIKCRTNAGASSRTVKVGLDNGTAEINRVEHTGDIYLDDLNQILDVVAESVAELPFVDEVVY